MYDPAEMNNLLSFRLDEPEAVDVLSVRLAKGLTRAIIMGRIPGNLHLTEDRVLAWTSASRSPVREALRILEQDGLVRREPRRGVRVAPMTLADLDEVYRVRVVLEGLVAECAAESATEVQIRELDRLLEVLSSPEVLEDAERYFSWNVQFSAALYDATNNQTLQRIISGLSKQALRYRFLVYDKVPAFRKESLQGARRVARAIRNHQADRAQDIQRRLMMSSWKQIRPHIEVVQSAASTRSEAA